MGQAILPTSRTDPAGVCRILLTSFDVEIDWLESLFPDVPITYVGNPGRGPDAPRAGLYQRGYWEMCVPPSPNPRALQHAKLVVLFYQERVRVIVSSANFTQLDWTRYDNTFFVQDFRAGSGGEFGVQLRRLFATFGIKTHAAVDLLSEYDFSSAASLVASWPIARVAKGWSEMEACGLGRLHAVVRRMYTGKCTLEAQGSSLAQYDRRWLEQFSAVASGLDTAHFPLPRSTDSAPWPPVRILFPTQRWVENEALQGIGGGGCFFGRADGFEQRGMRHLYAQPESKRGRLFMHAKSLLAKRVEKQGGSADIQAKSAQDRSAAEYRATMMPPSGWLYAGSANFTRAAWGTISGSRTAPTLSVSNWELGVVVPLDADLDCCPLDAVAYAGACPYGPTDTPWDVRTVL